MALPPSGCTRSWRRCPGRVGRRSRRDCYLSGSSRIRAPSGPASGPRPGSSPGRTRLHNTARKTIKRYSDKRIIAHLSKTRIKHSFFVVFLFFSVVLGYTTRLIFSSRCYLTDNWLSLRCFWLLGLHKNWGISIMTSAAEWIICPWTIHPSCSQVHRCQRVSPVGWAGSDPRTAWLWSCCPPRCSREWSSSAPRSSCPVRSGTRWTWKRWRRRWHPGTRTGWWWKTRACIGWSRRRHSSLEEERNKTTRTDK